MTHPLHGTRVLVTGGAGFIGSHLVGGLLEAGALVRVLDDLSTGSRRNLERCDVELVVGDVRDPAACIDACDGVELVFHQAAICSVARSMDDPATTIAINVAGTANVLAAARARAVSRVVYASSSSVFGDAAGLPQREGEEGVPQSIYALSKRMDEELADSHARAFGMTIVGLRYFNVFGPRQDPNGPYAAVVPRFFEACRRGERPVIYGDGLQTRDFIDVRDVVRANLLAATASLRGAYALNIASGLPTSVASLAERIAGLAGRPDLVARHEPARAGDIPHSVADTRRAKELLRFEVAHPLDDGLAALAALPAG